MKESANKQTYLKRALILICGSIIFGIGIGVCNLSDLGMDPMSVLSDGIAVAGSLRLGQANAILNITEIGVALLLDRKNVSLITLATVITISFGIDLVGLMHIGALPIAARIILLILGFLIYTFGIAVTQAAGVGYSGYDAFIFSLGKLFHTQSYHLIRWGTDGIFLILGVILGGTAGVGTVLVLIAAGKAVEFFLKIIENRRSK